MAFDQNSVLNRTVLPFPTPPPPWAPVLPPHPPTTTAEQPDEQPSTKKVKLLCSFGGRILPRPGDGALRYVGGHTRIISVPNDVSFPDLMIKMAEACGSAGPVALKYQLPDEDLDALISVSCPEDLENMMEEYDKVTAASLDGSAKLRTFLFSPSSDSTGPPPSLHLDDTGQSYIDALNWVADDCIPHSMQRKESVESTASYTHPDGIIGGSETADGSNEGTSPPLLSPTFDASRLVYLGANVPAVGSIVPAQTQNPAWMEPPPAAPYAQQAYIGPHQVQYINQPLGMAGGHPTINLVPFTPHPYQPATQIITNSLVAHASGLTPIQPRVDPFMGENQYGGRVVQPLSQLPPLPPAYLQPQNVEQFGLNQMPPQGQMLRFDDCLMCQKALPHAHSDTLLQGHGNGTPGGILEVSPPFYGHHSEDTRKVRTPQIVTGALADNAVEPKVTSPAAASQLGAHGFPQTVQYPDERPVQQKIDNLDRVGVLLPPVSLGLSGDAQSSHGMLLNDLPQSRHEDPLQQQPQRRNLGPPLYQVKQEVITKPLGIDASFVRNERLQQPSQSLMGDTVHESSNDYARPIDAMMEGLRVSPTDNSWFNEQWKAVAKPKLGSPVGLEPSSFEPGSSPLDVENDYYLRPQAGGYEMFSDRVIANSGIVPEGNFVKPINQLPPTSSDVAHTQNLQPAGTIQVSNMIGNHSPNTSNLGLEVEPPAPNGWLLGMPVYPCSIDPAYNDRTINKIPAGNWNEGASQFHTEDVLNHIPATQRGNILFPSSTATSPHVHVEPSQEPVTSDSSLFCNEDPWKVLGVAQLLPPKPGRMANEESVISKDSFIGKHLGNGNDSDIVTLLEEGSFYPLPDPLDRDLRPEPVRPGKGSTVEHIKQELQAVAEDVAAAVLHSSVPPVPVFITHETKEHNGQFDKERGIIDDNAESQGEVAMVDQTIEDTKPRCLDKMNPGLQITEDIGRLQIIKNSDLEELRELGSGTFGTVYHGKWRGSDVAIKRINDRCFAGKPSEQERLRSDFWNEACKLADLHHPNVVAFYGVVLDGPGGSVATVTEYMVNGSLRNALQSNERTFDRRKRLLIATDVAFGMEYLHGKNIVHFDLKSDNLLVNLRDPQRPICKVGDLGLSKVKCQTLISGGVRGTLPWMAPELLNGSSSLVSEKVDVFSFGIVMWELLTGEEPYADLHYGAIIGGIVSNTLRPLVPESCDPEWRLLMENCWSAEPSERPSFTEIASRLRSVAASLPQKGHNNQRPQASVV